MANTKAKTGNKNMLIGVVCAALAVVVIVVVAILLLNKGGINDSYFVSDGSKYVITMESEEQGDVTEPMKTHYVYMYSGDSITGMKVYAEYKDDNAAKVAYDAVKASDPEGTYELSGKYVVLTMPESEYKDLTASDVKQQMEFVEMLKNMSDEEDTGTEVEVIDGDEELLLEDDTTE